MKMFADVKYKQRFLMHREELKDAEFKLTLTNSIHVFNAP